jgi:hypothetical protein
VRHIKHMHLPGILTHCNKEEVCGCAYMAGPVRQENVIWVGLDTVALANKFSHIIPHDAQTLALTVCTSASANSRKV